MAKKSKLTVEARLEDHLTKEVSRITQALGRLQGSVQQGSNSLKKMEVSMARSSKGLSRFAKVGAVAGVVLAGLVGLLVLAKKAFDAVKAVVKKVIEVMWDAVKVFAEFDNRMREVWTLTTESAKGFRILSDEVQKFAQQYGVEAVDVAGALYQTISAGFGQEEAAEGFNVMSESLKFAKATMTSARDSVDLMTTVMNSYGYAASEATRVTELLFKAVQLGKTTGSEMALSFGRVASMAAAAKVPLADLLAAQTALTRAGLKQDEAMTALRQVISKIVNPTNAAAVAVERLGLTLFKEETLARPGGLLMVLQEIGREAGFTTKPLKEFVDIIRNIRAVTGLAAMSRQLEDIPGFLNDMNNSLGVTETALQKIMKGVAFQISQFEVSIKSAKRSLGEFVAQQPAIRGFMDIVLDKFQKFNEGMRNTARDTGQAKNAFALWKKVLLDIMNLLIMLVDLATKMAPLLEVGNIEEAVEKFVPDFIEGTDRDAVINILQKDWDSR